VLRNTSTLYICFLFCGFAVVFPKDLNLLGKKQTTLHTINVTILIPHISGLLANKCSHKLCIPCGAHNVLLAMHLRKEYKCK